MRLKEIDIKRLWFEVQVDMLFKLVEDMVREFVYDVDGHS